MQKSFVFDINKCTGCEACYLACMIENGLDPKVRWRTVLTFNTPDYPHIPRFHYSLACNHCIEAPCITSCPACAIERDIQTGSVLISPEKCIGCQYCSWVCPYDAPQYDHSGKVMEKCTFCSHRLAEDREPACVAGCPTGALKLADYSEKDEYMLPGFPSTGIKPAIELIPLRDTATVPETTAYPKKTVSPGNTRNRQIQREKQIGLRHEWPLVLFSLVAVSLVSYFSGSAVRNSAMNLVAFLGTGLAGMLISMIHLGKRSRAYRALLNWKNSWISREILFFMLFMITAGISIKTGGEYTPLNWAGILTGFIALFSIEKVYHFKGRIGWTKLHSANVLITGLFLSGIVSGQWLMIGWFGFLKAFVYTTRKHYYHSTGEKIHITASLLRITAGFIVPVILYGLNKTENMEMIIGMILIGELIDRCEYYNELETVTPAKQVETDLETMVRREQRRNLQSSYRLITRAQHPVK